MSKKTEAANGEFDIKSLNLYEFLGRDISAEEEGKFFPLEYDGKTHPTISFKIRSLGSDAGSKYSALVAKYERELKSKNGGKELSVKDKSVATMRALIDSGVVCDWRGIEAGGVALPFAEYAERVLTDLTYDYAAAFIINTALTPKKFRESLKGESEKN